MIVTMNGVRVKMSTNNLRALLGPVRKHKRREIELPYTYEQAQAEFLARMREMNAEGKEDKTQ